MKEEISNNSWARVCDTCRSAACAVYCRADSAYLCAGCDARVHAANRVASRHERVWVCEACERAPAAFVCKADAASLCASCDADIHSANPLARRHHRVPVLPISGSLPQDNNNNNNNEDDDDDDEEEEDDEEAASWLLLPKPNNNAAGTFLFGGGGEVVDDYLDLIEYSTSDNSLGDHGIIVNNHFGDDQVLYGGAPPQKIMIGGGGYGAGDSVVPCGDHLGGKGHNNMMRMMMMEQQQQQGPQGFQLGLDHFDDHSPKGGYSYSNASITHSVSVSSMDVSVVPDTATMNDISIPHQRPPKGTVDLFSHPPIQMPAQLSPMDREARVLRYREKKKMRKFEKTIRYASRKAYAETRPRIKGRFAKRTDVEAEVDQIFSAAVMADTGYGIVPSF